MKKYFICCFCSVFLLSAAAAAQNERYVRKMPEPEFFIPEGDKFNRPEKLPPIYLNGKKVTGSGEEETAQNAAPQKPGYQQKYGQYQEDLKSIAVNGEIAPNKELDNALESMKTGEVFEVKETPSQNSEVKDRFEKAVVETLTQN